jgi:hypothetical protein
MNRWVVATSLAASILLFGVAFWLGASYFDLRRTGAHATRLQHLLEAAPTVEQVTEGLRLENSPLLGAPVGEEALRAAAARWGRGKQEEVVAKGRRWPKTRVFRAGDMVYFLFFDEAGVLRDYLYVSA